jgi:undecaprenyl-diphosphatase
VADLFHAVLLGLVQGLTEFIPISSSGHLVLLPHFLDIETPGIAFDVALHVGTFAAVVLYFRTDLWHMLTAVVGIGEPAFVRYHRRLAALLVLATIPIALVGLLLGDIFEAAFASPTAAAGFLLVTGVLLLLGEAARSRRGGISAPTTDPDPQQVAVGYDAGDHEGLTLDQVGVRQALVIGFGQCVALFPGLSRSGTTIAAGMSAGLTRPAATRFSFLLALPALVGASVISLPDLASVNATFGASAIIAGVAAAFASGYLAIRWLLALVARDRLTGFAWYCFAVGGLSLVALASGV